MEEKPEQTVHTERKEIASTVVNPMTSKEIQDQMSGFPEVIKNPQVIVTMRFKFTGNGVLWGSSGDAGLKCVIWRMTITVDCSISGNSELSFWLSRGNAKNLLVTIMIILPKINGFSLRKVCKIRCSSETLCLK